MSFAVRVSSFFCVLSFLIDTPWSTGCLSMYAVDSDPKASVLFDPLAGRPDRSASPQSPQLKVMLTIRLCCSRDAVVRRAVSNTRRVSLT